MSLEREYSTKKIDSAGRITLPKNLRIKYDFNEGKEVEFLTLKRNGLTYLCITLSEELEARLEEEDLEILLSFDGDSKKKKKKKKAEDEGWEEDEEEEEE